jgi:hypothetical protein
MAIVELWSGTMTIEVCLKIELAVFVKITYFLFRSVWAKTRQFLTNRERCFFPKRPCSKGKRILIIIVPDHYPTIAILLNPFPLHCTLPLTL